MIVLADSNVPDTTGGVLNQIHSTISSSGNPQFTSEVGALMRNPAVLAAIQDRLAGMVGMPGGYIQR